MFSFFDGIGKLTSYVLAATSYNKPKLIPDEPDFATDARLQFGIAAAVALVCVGITLVTVREPPAPPATNTRSLRTSFTYAWSLALRVFRNDDAAHVAAPTTQAYQLVRIRDDDLSQSRREPSLNGKREALERAAGNVFEQWTMKEMKEGCDLLQNDDEKDGLRLAEPQTPEACNGHADISRDDDAFDDALSEEGDDVDDGGGDDYMSFETLRRVCLVELGLWFGLSVWQVWGAILVGKSILGGDPAGKGTDREKFESGVLLFSLGLAGANLISLLAAPLFPCLLRTFGARCLFIVGSLVMTCAMAALAAAPSLFGTVFLDRETDTDSSFDLVGRHPRFLCTVLFLASLGVPWACHMNIGFSVVGRAYQDAPDVGLITATLNTSLCVAQLAMSFLTAILIRISQGDAAICFLAASISGIIATYHSCKLKVPYDEADQAAFNPPVAACAH